jgi:hypothetical protein
MVGGRGVGTRPPPGVRNREGAADGGGPGSGRGDGPRLGDGRGAGWNGAAGSSSSSSTPRRPDTSERSDSWIRRSSRIPFPTCRATSGTLFGPKTSSAITRMTMISGTPRFPTGSLPQGFRRWSRRFRRGSDATAGRARRPFGRAPRHGTSHAGARRSAVSARVSLARLTGWSGPPGGWLVGLRRARPAHRRPRHRAGAARSSRPQGTGRKRAASAAAPCARPRSARRTSCPD